MAAGLVDQLGILAVAIRQGTKQPRTHDVGKAHDGVQGRAQFVAHIGQEAGLAGVLRLGLAAGGLELGLLIAPGPAVGEDGHHAGRAAPSKTDLKPAVGVRGRRKAQLGPPVAQGHLEPPGEVVTALGQAQIKERPAGQIRPGQGLAIGAGDAPIGQQVEQLGGLFGEQALQSPLGDGPAALAVVNAPKQADDPEGQTAHRRHQGDGLQGQRPRDRGRGRGGSAQKADQKAQSQQAQGHGARCGGATGASIQQGRRQGRQTPGAERP